MKAVALIAHKEAAELLKSGRGLAWLLALSAALSVFGLLLVSDTELSLLDNARVVYDMVGIVMALGALLGVIAGSDTVAGERERGSLLPLLVAPVARGTVLAGKWGGQLIAWFALYLLALPYLWAVGSTGQNLAAATFALLLFGTPVALTFGSLAMGLGARLPSVRSTVAIGLLVLVVAASPLVLGPSLRQTVIARIFDTVNPFSAALDAADAVIIDAQPIASQWVRLGTMWFWFVAGVWFAARGFRRLDR